jgi:asparagine synthase (glutamine-hydrolysing)
VCGIAGFLAVDPTDTGSRPLDVVRAINRALAHRGPDAEGARAWGPCALGHRRLAIIDLSPDAAQPLVNEAGTVAVVVNGEIYNFASLRAELLAKGHTFRSRSDSEVVVHLYEEHGEDCIARLDGMFALALWDARRRRLLLARDRTGKKPLAYRVTPEGLAFASELHPLVTALPIARPEVDADAIDAYLTLGYIPAPASAWRGVRKLPAGHLAVVEPGGEVLPRRYWKLHRAPVHTSSHAELVARLRELLRDAVRRRMVSDVPLGAFLSGGMDSSTVVALMASLSPRPVKTFSIGFPNADDSELTHARAIARHFGTDHHELVVSPDTAVLVESIVRHHGEPFADSSAVATACLARMTRDHVTVALSGDGADEVFAGYKRYAPARLAHLHDRLPASVGALFRRALAPAVAFVHPDHGRFVRDAGLGEAARYLHLVARFDDDARAALRGPALRGADGRVRARFEAELSASDGTFPMARLLDVDFAVYLTDDIHAKVDIASMAHALEVRCPFLDTALLEFAARLPMRSLFALRGKRILRDAMKGLLPEAPLTRLKRGFALPLERWMRHDLREMTRDLLLGPRARQRGVTNPVAVEALLRRGARADVDRLWTLLVLEQWYRTFVDG